MQLIPVDDAVAELSRWLTNPWPIVDVEATLAGFGWRPDPDPRFPSIFNSDHPVDDPDILVQLDGRQLTHVQYKLSDIVRQPTAQTWALFTGYFADLVTAMAARHGQARLEVRPDGMLVAGWATTEGFEVSLRCAQGSVFVVASTPLGTWERAVRRADGAAGHGASGDRLVPPVDDLVDGLRLLLAGLQPQTQVVLHHRDEPRRHVQFASSATQVSADTLSSASFPQDVPLSEEACARLTAAGWVLEPLDQRHVLNLELPSDPAGYERFARALVEALAAIEVPASELGYSSWRYATPSMPGADPLPQPLNAVLLPTPSR